MARGVRDRGALDIKKWKDDNENRRVCEAKKKRKKKKPYEKGNDFSSICTYKVKTVRQYQQRVLENRFNS